MHQEHRAEVPVYIFLARVRFEPSKDGVRMGPIHVRFLEQIKTIPNQIEFWSDKIFNLRIFFQFLPSLLWEDYDRLKLADRGNLF